MARLVLVHGAWGSPRMWDPVVARLGDRADEVVRADLPTMRAADASFADDVGHVRELLGDAPHTVVCGHSYGGAVITEAAAGRNGVTQLVYLAAVMPAEGESLATWSSRRRNDDGEERAGTAAREDGTVLPDGWADDTTVYEPATLAYWSTIPPRPFAASAAGTPVRAAAWRDIPSTYVVALRDTSFDLETQRTMAARATRSVDVDAGHMVHLARPRRVAEVLVEALQGAPTR